MGRSGYGESKIRIKSKSRRYGETFGRRGRETRAEREHWREPRNPGGFRYENCELQFAITIDGRQDLLLQIHIM